MSATQITLENQLLSSIAHSAPELSEAKETSFLWHEKNSSDTLSQQHRSGSSSGSSGSNSDGEGTTTGYYDITRSRRYAQVPVDVVPQGNPVIIDIDKEAPYIGEEKRNSCKYSVP